MIKRLIKLKLALAVRLCDVVADGVRRLTGRPAPDRCVVLYYHGVTDDRRERFERQMQWLVVHTVVVPVKDMRSAAGKGRCCCVTFDDALDSVRVNAWPVCERLGIPLSIYAVSGNLGDRPRWQMPPGHPDAHEMIMTGEQLRSLPAAQVTIGSHTVTHPALSMIAAAEQFKELAESKRQLEALLDRPVSELSVPYGLYRQDTLTEAQRAGYDAVLTCDPEVVDPAHPALTIGRFKVTPDDWMIEFRLAALGAYRWRKWLRRGGRQQAAPHTASEGAPPEKTSAVSEVANESTGCSIQNDCDASRV